MKRKIFKRIIISVIITTIMVSFSTFAVAEEKFNYEDVKKYYPYSSWAVDIGTKYSLIFLENNRREVKRWEIVNIVYNILELEKVKEQAIEFTDLTDVSSGIRERVYSVSNEGIILGYEDGTFKPFNNVTRAEFAIMLDRTGILNGKINTVSLNEFDDTKNHWAKGSINKIAKYGIVLGKGNNKFCPEDNITAQEILVILDRLEKNNYINSKTIETAMTDTFKCKKYTEKERYIIEVLYSKFDEVQNDIKYRWPYKEYYNPSNWQELATYEDLLVAMYFTAFNGLIWYDEGKTGREKIDLLKDNIMHVQGLDIDKEIDWSKTFNMRNLLKAAISATYMDDSFLSMPSTDIKFGSGNYIDKVNFTNMEEMSNQDKMLVAYSCASNEVTYHNPLFDDKAMYFPLDVPVTKYILNYVILRLQDNHNYLSNISGVGLKKYLGVEKLKFETDASKIPNNYYLFPFIIQGIPKEMYEKTYMGSEKKFINTPVECFEEYSKYLQELIDTSYEYYDTILNVDYRTINVDDFVDKTYLYGAYVFERDARKYAQYVIDNKIILKGRGCAIPGTIFISNITAYIKVMVEFEVISAKEKKNLLLGDFDENMDEDVIYTKDKYSLYFDTPISGSFWNNNGNWAFGHYKIMYHPILLSFYPNYESYIMP